MTKKIFLPLIFAIAGIVGLQAQESIEKVLIDAFVEGIDKEMSTVKGEDGLYYLSTVLEGKNVVVKVRLDESGFGGMSMRQAFQMVGVNETTYGTMMREAMFEQNLSEDERAMLQMLSDYGYKIYFRLIGDPSGDVMDCFIDYEALLR